jgi:morphogenetic protein associated with SpoVID
MVFQSNGAASVGYGGYGYPGYAAKPDGHGGYITIGPATLEVTYGSYARNAHGYGHGGYGGYEKAGEFVPIYHGNPQYGGGYGDYSYIVPGGGYQVDLALD